MGRRLAGWIGGMAAVAALPAACGKGEKEGDVPAKTGAYRDFLTVDIYDAQANFQGTQSGRFARMLKDCFNMELNLIFPNVAGGGETLYETRAANGNPGDLIFVRADRNYLRDLVRSGLAPYLSGEENLERYQDAIRSCSGLSGQEGLWAVPSEISEKATDETSESAELTNGRTFALTFMRRSVGDRCAEDRNPGGSAPGAEGDAGCGG